MQKKMLRLKQVRLITKFDDSLEGDKNGCEERNKL
jgi:hypothetical protein